MPFADVCVNTPLGRRVAGGQGEDAEYDPLGQTFTYAVPPRLAGRLRPGHLAWVPFRGRRLQAVVLRLSDAPPAFDTHEIISLVWAQPLLTPAQLALAHWISEYYLSPLIEALRLMLPVGMAQRGRTVLVRTAEPAPAADLTPTQAALLARIAEAEGEWAEVTAGLRGVTQRDDLEPLIAAGLITREVAFPTPPPRPKTDRQVRLLADAATIKAALPTLGRATKQAEVLTRIADCKWQMADGKQQMANGKLQFAGDAGRDAIRNTQYAIPLAELCQAVGCTEAPVKALAKRGWVTITRPGPKEPAMVSLALEGDALLDAIVELRGAHKHRAVLEALLRHDGPPWIGWVYAETGATLDTLRDLEAAGLLTVAEEMVWRDPLAGQEFTLDQPPTPTEDQERVWEVIRGRLVNWKTGTAEQIADCKSQSAICNLQSAIYLLHGVTGSGKTEIYLRAIAEVLRQGKQAVALVPEIALTPQTIRRFAARFPGQVTVWHSALSDGERFDVWRRVRTNHPAAQVVVGSRSALFLPFPALGLIVLDEEHEPSYKQERTPRYHGRTAAIELGRICSAAVLLGSATPALETYHAARRGEIELLTLPKRILGRTTVAGRPPAAEQPRLLTAAAPEETTELPPVQVVDMRQELRAGNRSMFSRPLSAQMRRVLAAGQQAILYLNRRGAATFVMCRDCGRVESCARCGVPLTYHSAGQALVCHHCNRRSPTPATCADCGSRRIRYFGAGTENVEEAVKLEFPQARTLRWDRDVTVAKGSHDAILGRFIAHDADVLIGTQMIAKGLDLPLVTLVGVIAADVGLFLPDFRAGERTFQLLTQVAGRAGRTALGGQVIVQTYHPDHPAIVAASRHDYEAFYRQEMGFRREQNYPPLRRLARLVYHHSQRAKAQAEATRLAKQLRGEIGRLELADTDLIGPAPCFFAMQRGEHRWHVVVRSPDPATLLRRVPLPLGWRLDIDPVDLL
ncbi:MAG: primosomal protein N' [Chloroflexi bacterium]|nr:primosomal protein N' [Chloroflexota bacterium]